MSHTQHLAHSPLFLMRLMLYCDLYALLCLWSAQLVARGTGLWPDGASPDSIDKHAQSGVRPLSILKDVASVALVTSIFPSLHGGGT